MNNLQHDVRAWMKKAGQSTELYAYGLNGPQQKLYLSLISEEFNELNEAWMKDDLIGTVDGIADLVWVIMGFCNSIGVDFQPIWDEIRRSNMTKVSGKLKTREDGKVVKPKHYEKPNLEDVLFTSLRGD